MCCWFFLEEWETNYNMEVSPNGGYPHIIHFNRIFHEINQPAYWGFPIYGTLIDHVFNWFQASFEWFSTVPDLQNPKGSPKTTRGAGRRWNMDITLILHDITPITMVIYIYIYMCRTSIYIYTVYIIYIIYPYFNDSYWVLLYMLWENCPGKLGYGAPYIYCH